MMSNRMRIFQLREILRVLPVSLLLLAFCGPQGVRGQLLVDFYASTCPKAESIVTAAVQAATVADPFMPAKLLRLFFHDCFVGGCDGSILIDPSANNSNVEKTDPANGSVDGYAVVDNAKAAIEALCPGVVSCADIVALAARDGVLLTGGPPVRVPTGRRDGLVSDASKVRANVPVPTSDLTTLIAIFASKGLNLNDLIILAGAHTIGSAHCSSINDRIKYNNGNATIDPTMNPTYAQTLLAACPQTAPASATVAIDSVTDQVFDIQYFTNLQVGKGLLTSDQVLFSDARTQSLVNRFALSQVVYFENWGPSFIAMGNIGAVIAPGGEIRTNCRAFNSG